MNLFAISSIAILAALLVNCQQPNVQISFCGNGRVDPGEQCDPADSSISADCCDSNCRLLPSSTVCSNGMGVCTNTGNCTTRASICSSYNENLLRIPSNTQTGDSIGGPFGVCYADTPLSSLEQRSIQSLIKSNSTSTGSVLSKLLPPAYLVQTQCSMACSGRSTTNQDESVCIDFKKYQNLPGLTPDYIGCAVDKTVGVNFSAMVTAKPSNNQIEKYLVQPGVCVTGVCRTDICRNVRCNGRGDCGLTAGALQSIKKNLGIGNDNGAGQSNEESSMMRCNCDEGYHGSMCQFAGNVSISNGGGTQDSSNISDPAVFAGSIVGTFALTSLAFLILMYLRRNRRDNEKGQQFFAPSQSRQEKDVEKAVQDAVLNAYPPAKESSMVDASDKSDNSFNTFFGNGPSGISDDRQTVIPEETSTYGTAAASSVQEPRQSPNDNNEPTADITDQSKSAKEETVVANSLPSKQHADQAKKSYRPEEATKKNNYLRAAHIYYPRMADEIELAPGDILYLIRSYDDGWAKAYNVRTGKEGIFPLSFAKKAK